MSDETVPEHIFRSSVTDESIKHLKSRYSKFRTVLIVHLIFNVVSILILLGVALTIAFLFINLIGGLLLGVASLIGIIYLLRFFLKGPNYYKEAESYYIGMYKGHMILNSGTRQCVTIEYDDITSIAKYSRPLERFRDDDFEREHEQKSIFPYIYIATSNENIYKIRIIDTEGDQVGIFWI